MIGCIGVSIMPKPQQSYPRSGQERGGLVNRDYPYRLWADTTGYVEVCKYTLNYSRMYSSDHHLFGKD